MVMVERADLLRAAIEGFSVSNSVNVRMCEVCLSVKASPAVTVGRRTYNSDSGKNSCDRKHIVTARRVYYSMSTNSFFIFRPPNQLHQKDLSEIGHLGNKPTLAYVLSCKNSCLC